MPFDLSSAKPVDESGFDVTSAQSAAQSVSPAEQAWKAVRSPTERYLPDVAMGAAQTVGALSQLRARSSGTGVPQVEEVNQRILDMYNRMFQNEKEAWGPAIRRVLGQLPPVMKAAGTVAGVAGQGAGLGGLSQLL